MINKIMYRKCIQYTIKYLDRHAPNIISKESYINITNNTLSDIIQFVDNRSIDATKCKFIVDNSEILLKYTTEYANNKNKILVYKNKYFFSIMMADLLLTIAKPIDILYDKELYKKISTQGWYNTYISNPKLIYIYLTNICKQLDDIN